MNDAAVEGETVADYKRLLQAVCDNRPSGTRGRLAVALGTNRSFVSQLVNPAYAMPIPVQHLETIFEICHFSPADRAVFLAVYDSAHPGRRVPGEEAVGTRVIAVTVPDLGNARRNQTVDALVAEYGRHVARLVTLLKD
jgi:hypothetical protein